MEEIKITQEKAVFYILWKAYHEDPNQFIPAWKFVGELYLEELGTWFFMSYKCPANGVNVVLKNPELFERRQVKGKTGAKYFEYRIANNPSESKISDSDTLKFYRQLKESARKFNLSKRIKEFTTSMSLN